MMPLFDAEDIIIWATPVYAGRIPNKTLDYVRNAIHADGNISVALVTFGNRAYDNALAELVGLMDDGGMRVVGAAAMVTRHVFSETLGSSRPNADDISALEDFAAKVAEKILSSSNSNFPYLKVPGEAHPEKYYTPLKSTNVPASFLKAKPSCDTERCMRCGKCQEVCPMGSITLNEGVPLFDGICIKCQACRLICPDQAIAFTDSDYHSHIAMLEQNFSSPKKAEFFVNLRHNLQKILAMKRLTISLLMCLMFALGTLDAQEMTTKSQLGWADGWKYAFSKEGMKEWKPECTLRNTGGLFTGGPMFTGGVRVDEKRSFSLFLGQGDTWIGHVPADVYSIRTGVSFRRYWHLGERKTFALYSDLGAGVGYVYKIRGEYRESSNGIIRDVVAENVGDMMFVAYWQPGVRVRFYKNIHIFLGALLSTDSIGLHWGLGF